MVPQQAFAKVAGATIRDLSNLFIVPILSFFLLRDGSAIRDSFIDLMFDRKLASIGHHKRRRAVENVLEDGHKLILDYMRALLVLCFATLVAYGLAFKIMGVPYGLLLAFLAFPLEFVPLVGPLTSA